MWASAYKYLEESPQNNSSDSQVDALVAMADDAAAKLVEA